MPTGNTQQVINYGASANDGQGDPLRTAFIKTDENFDNIWLAGPVGSNVTITNNTIGVLNTNGNLILAPNGVGVIQTNNHVVPRANRTYDLGSANLQYRTVYANSAALQTLSVSGNLTVSGNIINTGNIVTDTLTIQLANTTTTANAANGAGITVGASDNIATILYNSTSNVWTTNIGLSATGNITAPYFIGNGSQLTGIVSSYGNSNVTTLLASLGSNTINGTGNITTTANISGGNILGNGRQLTGIISSYGNANVAANLAAFGSNPISTTGNISGEFILGNISLANGFPATYGNANVANYLPTFSGNISAGNVSATGNISGNYFIGNGSQLTGLNATTSNISNGTSNVDIPVANGNVIINTAGTYSWTFDDTGNLTIPNDIVSNTTIDIDNRASGNSADIQLFAADDITLQARDRSAGSTSEGGDINIFAGDSAEDGDSSGGDIQILAGDGGAANVDFGGPGGFITIRSGQGGAAIGNSGYSAESGGALTLNAGDAGSNNGNIDLGADGGNVYIGAGDSTGNGVNGGTIYLTSGAADASALAGDVVIQAGGTWTFDGAGNLSAPGNVSAVGNITADYFIGDGSQLTGITANTGNVTFNDVNIIGTGNLNLQPIGENSEYLNIYLTGAADIHVAYGGGSGNVILGTDEEANVAVLQGGNVAIQAGNVAGTKTWAFDTAGNLTLPRGGIVYETNIPDGGLNGNTIALAPSGGTNADQQLLIYPTTNDANHLHLTSGNLYSTELFLGDDNLFVKLANTGNVVINSNDGVGNTAQWTFGTDGSLTLPIGVSIDNNVNPLYPKIIADSGKLFSVQGQGNTGSAALAWTVDPNAASQYASVGVTRLGDNLAKVVLQAQSDSGNAATAKTWRFDETGNLTLPGNMIISGNTSVFGTDAALIQTTDNRPLLALSSGANGAVSSLWVEDVANVGTSNIAAVYANPTVGSGIVRIVVGQNGGNTGPNLWDFDTTGNLTVPGNIIMTTGIVGSGASPAPYLSGFSSLSAITVSASGNISATGNVTAGNILTAGQVSATGNITTAGNFVGNGAALTNVTVSVAGNIVGTQSNVTLVAGSYNWTFDNTGNLTLPGNTFAVNYANNTPVNAVTRFESSWTVPVGNSTQSFTVSPNETYYMWVDCNIANGILAWNATGTVTNTNVPVVGAQYAWVYSGGGTPIDFTSIPDQFVGTSNTIVRSSVSPSATTNRFDFGINNTSGGNVTVRYGWIAIS